MTVLFSTAASDLITLTVDSAVTLTSGGRVIGQDTGRKAYHYQGTGCVATWGARQGNKIGAFLDAQQLGSKAIDVMELTELVFDYLRCDYQPHKDNLEDVGYHIAGFDREGRPRLFHAFWGVDRPTPLGQKQGYKIYQHDPTENNISLLFNGRNEIAETVIRVLAAELQQGKETRFKLHNLSDRVAFGDFVARFASEITPEVGPTLYTYLISHTNQIEVVSNPGFSPVDRNDIDERLRKLGYEL